MEISIRELKANPARAIALTQSGVRVQITSHRKVVAELVSPQTSADPPAPLTDEEALQKLMASGLISQPASKPFKLPKAMKLPAGPKGQTMSELVLKLRGPV